MNFIGMICCCKAASHLFRKEFSSQKVKSPTSQDLLLLSSGGEAS